MKLFSVFFVLVLKASIIVALNQIDLTKIREWKQLDFNFPNPSARSEAEQRGYFVARNNFPIDVDVDYFESLEKSRIFVTIPRFSDGIPVTLGYIKSLTTDLQITPYPDYSWHSSNGGNCNLMSSVLRVAIDDCHQLWVLDTGIINSIRKCPPQLFIFNLRTDKLVRNYKFPRSQYTDLSLFITPILDVKDPTPKCENTKVYIADVTGFALIVYDYALNKSWKIQNKLFYPYPNYGTFTIAGESFDLMDGLFALALSPKKPSDSNSNVAYGLLNRQNERALYFHSLASGTENAVSLNLVNNASIWERDSNSVPRAFQTLGKRGIQAAAQAMDRNGNLFFVLMDPIAIACWDSSTPYAAENIKIVLQNNENLQFASGVKIIRNMSGEDELWLLTNRFQKIAAGTLNVNEVNFRILTRKLSELLRGNPRCNGQPLNANFIFPST